MLPFKTMLPLDRASKAPLYLQITNALIKEVNFGSIQPGHKLPGSRKMAGLLGVNRRTVILAYEELESQGWVEIKLNSGCYISSELPKLHPIGLEKIDAPFNKIDHAFQFDDQFPFLGHFEPLETKGDRLVVDAGYPDIRLAPLKILGRNLNAIMRGKRSANLMKYTTSFSGDIKLRTALCKHLQESRSIHIGLDEIMITRGSLMAFFTIFQVLLKPQDKVIVGVPGFQVANNIIRIAGGELVEVPVDANGIQVDTIEQICQSQTIKAVFIMPHHHNPTTVSLSAERRMKLLRLAATYDFVIIEDDYDYDFHYASSPILPMASSDRVGRVIYVGSLSKTIAPSLRLGFIVAPKHLIEYLSNFSRFVDCHGNMAMERAIAMLFSDGEVSRYLKKTLKTYHQRRDHFCDVLRNELGDYVEFENPEGGMAAWVHFDPEISMKALRNKAAQKGLLISKSVFHDNDSNPLNAIRMGFASLDEVEADKAIGILKSVICTP